MINQYIVGHMVVIHFIMQRKSNVAKKKKSHQFEEICFPPFCLFSQQLSNHSAEGLLKIATIAVHVVDNLDFSCPLFHLRNTA